MPYRHLRKYSAVVSVLIFLCARVVQAGSPDVKEAIIESPKNNWGRLLTDVTVASKYMAHGYNFAGNDTPSLQPCIAWQTPIPEVVFKFWAAEPLNTVYKKELELDFLLNLSHTFFEKERYAMNLHGYFDYWVVPRKEFLLPHNERQMATGFKFNGGVAFPNLPKLGPVSIVPGYNYYHWTPENGGAFVEGGVSDFSLSFLTESAGWVEKTRRQTYSFVWAIDYNDGAFGSKPGWSHSVVGLSTGISVGRFTITPSVNYQWSFEPSVNPVNEFWAAISFQTVFDL